MTSRESVRRHVVLPCVAATLAALLHAAAFPPHDLAPLAWIATAPWMLALARSGAGGSTGLVARGAALSGVLYSVVLHVVACQWMIPLMRDKGGMSLRLAVGSYLVGALIVIPFNVLPALTVTALVRRIGAWAFVAMPLTWALCDIARTHMVFGFPWYLVGMTQARQPTILGVADLGGVHAVTVLVLLGNAFLALLASVLVAGGRPGELRVDRRAAKAALVAESVILAGLLHGHLALERATPPSAGAMRIPLPADESEPSPPAPDAGSAPASDASSATWRDGGPLTIALVQGAMPREIVLEARQDEDDARTRLQLRLTDLALLSGAKLVVWSESAYPATFATVWPLRRLQQSLRASAREDASAGPEVILGGLADVWPDPGRPRSDYTTTNTAILVDARGPKGRYDKRYLVPFGEYTPAPWFFTWIKPLAHVLGTMRAGTSDSPLHGVGGAYGTFICYEAVLPQHVRAVSRSGSDVLVNITNDGWFHGSSVPEQHLRFAMLRAVESRKWLLRCANSGISAVIAPDGRVVGRLEEGERGILLSSVTPRDGETVYVRLGDAPLVAIGLLMALLTFAGLIADRLEARAAREPLPAAAPDG